MTQEYLSAKQVAEYLGLAYITVKKNFPAWEKYGVIARRCNDRKDTGRLRFKRSELDKMMDSWKVTK